MFQPTVHFVSGFLGSGKTTAIVGACRSLMAHGVRTAIVTNDQGRVQVDHAFAQLSGVPATAVSNGCLCCRYDDFEKRLISLAEAERPDVVFAESVGSCADIVATVVKPFAAFRAAHRPRGALTTFVDIRLAEARLSGSRLPFSDNVLYIFDKQLEEADLIVANKRDKLAPERAEQAVILLRDSYPAAEVLLTSALDIDDIEQWVTRLSGWSGDRSRGPTAATGETRQAKSPRPALEIDYDRYAAGELELGWLDRRISIETMNGGAPVAGATVVALFTEIARRLAEAGAAVGHLKLAVVGERTGHKLSVTAADLSDPAGPANDAAMRALERDALGTRAEVFLNLRAGAAAETLSAIVDEAVATSLDQAETGPALRVATLESAAFHPGYPRPIHRLR